MVESMLQQCGYRTGLFTSPHLVDVRERIRLAGYALYACLHCSGHYMHAYTVVGNRAHLWKLTSMLLNLQEAYCKGLVHTAFLVVLQQTKRV